MPAALSQDIEERLAEIISERLESSRLIDKASNPLERAVLRMAYVNRLDIWDIEKRVGRSKSTIYRIKKDGIESIARSMTKRACVIYNMIAVFCTLFKHLNCE